MISVIIPLYNQEKNLPACLASLFAQSFKDYEVIIVNDGSVDQSVDAAMGWKEKFDQKGIRFEVFSHEKNKGAPAARNTGYRNSKGEYLFFCDADTRLEPLALEKFKLTLDNNPEAAYAYSSFYWGKKFFKLLPFDGVLLKKMPYICTMSLIRENDFPGFDEDLKKFQDWDLWLTMLEKGKTGVWINEALFTVSPGGTMSDWLPSLAYKLLPFLPAVKRYKKARGIIMDKHGL